MEYKDKSIKNGNYKTTVTNMDKKKIAAYALREMLILAAEESAANISFPYKGSFGRNVSDGAEKILSGKYNIKADINIITDGKRMPVSYYITINCDAKKPTQLSFAFTKDEAERIYNAAWHKNACINSNL